MPMTRSMRRLRDENGFGMLELLIALVVLNIGLFALMGAFNAATVAVGRAGNVTSAAAVADKQMEMYRAVRNCAIYLDPTTFPTKNSGSLYQSDTAAYSNVAFFDKSQTTGQQALQPWATSSTDSTVNAPWNNSIPTSCAPTVGMTNAIQTGVLGPDSHKFDVYTYMPLVQPTGGYFVKQVTIVVRDSATSKILARVTSVFDPATAK
jgi:type II secretory pathway pseudopilin PulG